MKAGRELDAKVDLEIFGFHIAEGQLDVTLSPDRLYWLSVEGKLRVESKNGPLPHYSTQIAAAWLVVEKMKNDWCNLEFMCGRYQAKFKTGARVIEYKYYEAQADTAPLAICLAALKAVEK